MRNAPAQVCEIFKNGIFVEDLFIIPFRNFIRWYIIDILELNFYTCKLCFYKDL